MLKILVSLLTFILGLGIIKEQLRKRTEKFEDEAVKSQESDLLIRFVQTPNDEVYWMEDNQMYMSELDKSEDWDPDKKSLVSMENLTANQLEKLIVIMDSLIER